MTADTFCCLYEVSVAEENFYLFFVSFYSHVFDVMVGQKQIFHHVFLNRATRSTSLTLVRIHMEVIVMKKFGAFSLEIKSVVCKRRRKKFEWRGSDPLFPFCARVHVVDGVLCYVVVRCR